MYLQQLEYNLAEKEAELKSELVRTELAPRSLFSKNEAAETYKELMEAFSDREIAVVSLSATRGIVDDDGCTVVAIMYARSQDDNLVGS